MLLLISKEHEITPKHYSTFQLSRNISRQSSFPNNIVFNAFDFIQNLQIFVKMTCILHNSNLSLGMIRYISTGFRCICCVLTYRQIMTQYGAMEGNGPLTTIKSDYVDSCVFLYPKSNQTFSKPLSLIVVLSISHGNPMVRFVFPCQSR